VQVVESKERKQERKQNIKCRENKYQREETPCISTLKSHVSLLCKFCCQLRGKFFCMENLSHDCAFGMFLCGEQHTVYSAVGFSG